MLDPPVKNTLPQTVRHGKNLVLRLVLVNNDKLIPAIPRTEGIVALHFPQLIRNRHDAGISRLMVVVIIVFLEVVDVENLYRKCSMVIPRPLKRTLQIIIQPEPVRQPRQRSVSDFSSRRSFAFSISRRFSFACSNDLRTESMLAII